MNELINLDLSKKQLKDYVNSGKYYSEIDEKIKEAALIVSKYIGQKNKVVIIDIDETMVSEYDFMVQYDFGWFDENLEEAQKYEHFPSFNCVIDFINYCINSDIIVIVLSSRRERHRNTVINLLANAGYTKISNIVLRPNEDKGTIQNFKIGQRKKIVDGGCDIILNIGDQPSDLDGGYADNIIKIPNPFYLIDSTI